MKQDEVKALMAGIAPVLKEYVDERLSKLSTTAAGLTTGHEMQAEEIIKKGFEFCKGYIDRGFDVAGERLAALETKVENFKHVGTWSSGKRYKHGNFVTDKGSMWHALADTDERPGESNAWQLVVKRGQDGKDAPPGAR